MQREGRRGGGELEGAPDWGKREEGEEQKSRSSGEGKERESGDFEGGGIREEGRRDNTLWRGRWRGEGQEGMKGGVTLVGEQRYSGRRCCAAESAVREGRRQGVWCGEGRERACLHTGRG
jgi:hypothetical protein